MYSSQMYNFCWNFFLTCRQSEDSSSHFYEQPKGFSRGRGDSRGFHGGRGRREHRYHNNRHSFPIDR